MDNNEIDFDNYFGNYSVIASDILDTSLTQTETVKIKYLTEIPDTPFATHVFTNVEVPVLRGEVNKADVENYLGFDFDECLGCCPMHFELKENDVDYGTYYSLYYYKDTWLRAINADGHYTDIFIGINRSYMDVFYPYVNSGAIDQGAYEVVFTQQVLRKYPELSEYYPYNVYGHFTLVTVPHGNLLNESLRSLFNIDTSVLGVINCYSWEDNLSYESYVSLRDEFNYAWLATAWGELSDFVSGRTHLATYYMIYSEPFTDQAIIGEGGQTDIDNPSSVLHNEVVSPVVDFFGNILGQINGLFSESSAFLKIVKIALGAVIVLAILYFPLKLVIYSISRSDKDLFRKKKRK